ncbi:MAG: nucleotidyltransferase domain-containing protein [Sporichthyaceae bacterium]
MDVTAADLRSFTTQGAQDNAKATYGAVKAALDGSADLRALDWEVFLQGSYANHTNTRGDSDVDVVVMLTSTFVPDIRRLSPPQVASYNDRRIPGTTTQAEFRRRVQAALVDYFGSERVSSKDKCLRVAKKQGYVDADVVPCMQHRLYTDHPPTGQPAWIEGISIQPLSGAEIVNYPKEHLSKGQDKNAACSGNYKPTVRQVKRLRRRAVDGGLLTKRAAPGYLLECLVSNVPNAYLGADEVQRVRDAIGWLGGHAVEDLRRAIWSGDRIHRLFVDDPGGHDPANARHVLQVLSAML